MCGIAGLIYFDSRPVDADLKRMSALISHRGPDQESEWIAQSHGQAIGFAHRRLSIRDLSENGRQPLASHSRRSMLVYNGELYNEAELIDDLRQKTPFQQRTRCDSEVLLECVETLGPRHIVRFNGIFAFACHDLETGETLLARDPVGIKPLYLWRDPRGRALAFASEVKAFLGLKEFSRQIDEAALTTFLAQGYVGPERSLMKDVTSLAPGQILKVRPDGRIEELERIRLDWFRSGGKNFDPANLRHEFEQAVRRQRISDVPLAIWQSAGIDSSLVNAASAQPRPLSLIFSSDVGDFDEGAQAMQVAQKLGSEVRIARFAEQADKAESFARLVWHLDGELADSSALAVGELAAATKPHATVVLSGDGADELFGGYATYGATRLAARIGGLLPSRPLQAVARALLARSTGADRRYPKLEMIGRLAQGLGRGPAAHAEWRRYGMPWDLDTILSGELRSLAGNALDDYRDAVLLERARRPQGDPAGWGQAADLDYYLPGDMLMKVDRMSMAHALEVRVPFLDLEFIRHVATLPPELRLPRNGRSKPLLRDMLSGFGLPPEITERRKTGFNVPLAHRLRTDYRLVLTDLLLEHDLVSPYLRPASVRMLATAHLEGKANHAYLLWTLMTFAQWRRHLEQPHDQ